LEYRRRRGQLGPNDGKLDDFNGDLRPHERDQYDQPWKYE
jgi:hypothetical protein